ncbi:hypothetical protein KXD40_004032 [Peronospora effusa]|uniref:F-box domain-containing protein n=1 Tax=Peronospora effusa TaxID=542832 RepID=A0A3M6VVQ1_9STRA|nr:hypothetical protein DD238_000410 [Peronospora effusa]UIZ22864.1 hypothetical protein KXD40_004032 [Peronospora effusa]CAI5702974.1 unnamed protein product [Peronospora effusa]
MLLELTDECKQRIWGFLDVQEMCRMACVARKAEQGVCMELIWQQHYRTLLAKGLEFLQTEWRMLGCRLQRGFANRTLLEEIKSDKVVAVQYYDEDKVVDAIDWKLWYRDTHVVLVRFHTTNTGYNQVLNALQALKTERSQLKKAMQNMKASANIDKRTRRTQMNCIRWMNRTHRRQAAISNSIQAQSAAMSKAELAERLQGVENTIQATTRELFQLRKGAIKSLHNLNTQLANGTKMLRDLEVHGT